VKDRLNDSGDNGDSGDSGDRIAVIVNYVVTTVEYTTARSRFYTSTQHSHTAHTTVIPRVKGLPTV
jgi:hypothetical protein